MQRPQVIITIALSGAIVIAIVVVYHVFDPTNSIYAPKCFLKTLTGYNCPGCGCQRLLYNWANGHFIEGLRYNYFFPIGVLYALLILLGRHFPRLHHVCTSSIAIYLFIIMYLLWWVVRNLLNV